jgi:hypothetical protein
VEEESNSWLRTMENPRHDELSPERLLEPEQRRAAKRNGKLLAERIRRELARAARATRDEQTDLEELSEFFALDDAGREDDGGARKVESFKVRPPASRKRTRQTRAPLDDNNGRAGGRATGTIPGSGSGGGGPGAGTGDRAGGSGTHSQRKPFPLAAPRTIAVPGDPRVRRILFTPSATGEAHLSFESSGVSEPEPLELYDGTECRVTCTAGQREEVTVMFAEPYDGPVEIVSWGEEPVDEDQ